MQFENVSVYFDRCYSANDRFWWRGYKNRYSTDPDDYPLSLLTQATLRLIRHLPPGRALDLGAGEGVDSIRLARCGYEVTAVEISSVAADKIRQFADKAGVVVKVENTDIVSYVPEGEFELVICNGVLHYIDDKGPVISRMQDATRRGGLNVISLWSNFTPVPACHQTIEAFCDEEQGIVTTRYRHWFKELLYFDRDRTDAAHPEEQEHSHSHIKLIARKPM